MTILIWHTMNTNFGKNKHQIYKNSKESIKKPRRNGKLNALLSTNWRYLSSTFVVLYWNYNTEASYNRNNLQFGCKNCQHNPIKFGFWEDGFLITVKWFLTISWNVNSSIVLTKKKLSQNIEWQSDFQNQILKYKKNIFAIFQEE